MWADAGEAGEVDAVVNGDEFVLAKTLARGECGAVARDGNDVVYVSGGEVEEQGLARSCAGALSVAGVDDIADAGKARGGNAVEEGLGVVCVDDVGAIVGEKA